MKNKVKIFLFLFLFISFLFFPFLNSPNLSNTDNTSIDGKSNLNLATPLTDEFSSIFTWKSNQKKLYNNSDKSLSLDSLVGNLTDFNPENSTSYTNLDILNVTLQPSNSSWTRFRDFDNDASLPSTNIALVQDEVGEMDDPYDTTVFFARNNFAFNITCSWEYNPSSDNLYTNLYLFNQSQFHNFENYIQPWRIWPNIRTIDSFDASHTNNDWLFSYRNLISGSGTLNETIKLVGSMNKAGWYYLVMWGPGYNLLDQPRVSTRGVLVSEGSASINLTANQIMDMYRPSLGKVNGFIDKPDKVYERIVEGKDEVYGDSLALIYIYEYTERKLEDGGLKSNNDWTPFIMYINPDSIGSFPNRVAYFQDDSWADFKDRYAQIIDSNSSFSDGTHNFKINITAELAPFLNETVKMNATISSTPISMENRLGSSIRFATTTNSHGYEIKPYNSLVGTTFNWTEIPRFPLTDLTLKNLYNDTINDFLNDGWHLWAIGKYFPKTTPFSLYFNSLFTAPFIVSGLESILLIKPHVKDWFGSLESDNLYFNSRFDIEVNTTVDIPVNFTINYPEVEPEVGQTSNLTLSIGNMGNPNITIDYMINFSMDFSMLLFSGSYNFSKSDRIHFSIPNQEINLLLGLFGVEDGLSGLTARKTQVLIDKALNQSVVADYISIENLSIGNHIVGNLISCDIRIHLWPIIKYLGEKYLSPPHKWYFKVATYLIDKIVLDESTGLDFVISPQLQGVINGTIVGDGMDFNNEGVFEFNDTQKSITFQFERTQDFNLTSIQLQNILYFLNFHIDWAFEVNFNNLLHILGVEDLRWDIGTYPSINFAYTQMNNSDIVSLNWNDFSSLIPIAPPLSITTPSPTSSFNVDLDWTSSSGADNYTLYRYTSPIITNNLNNSIKLKTIAGTSTTDIVPTLGRWYYAVTANNETGSSGPSNSPYIDVQEVPTPPSPPVLTINTLSPTTSFDISIEWTPSPGADNYTLYRYTSPITSSNLNLTANLKTIIGTTTTDTVPGIGRWYYAVVATNAPGSSNPSNSPYIDIQEELEPPSPPVLTITTPSPTTSFDILVEWTTSAGADNYTLYRYISPINSSNLNLATEVKIITGTTTTNTVPGIGRWYYVVIATNETGSSDLSNYDFIDVEEAPPSGSPAAIPGYTLYFIGLTGIMMTVIVYKKKFQGKQKS